MKKIIFLTSTFLLFIGCNSNESKENASDILIHSIMKDNNQTLKSIFKEMIFAQKQSIEIIDEYIDLPINNDIKSIKTVTSKPLSFNDIWQQLPDDLSTLVRSKATRKLNSQGEYQESIISTSLEEELNNLNEAFELILKNNAQNLTNILTLDGVKLDQNTGDILIDDYYRISPLTIEGYIAIKILNSEALGENIEDSVKDINQQFKELASELGIIINDNNTYENIRTIKGMYYDQVSNLYYSEYPVLKTWQNGLIYFSFKDINQTYQNEIIKAMTDWEQGANKIKFQNVVNHRCLKFIGDACNYINTPLIITTADLGESTRGNSYIGVGTNPILNLNINSKFNMSISELQPVIRHELGHTIGLHHEHQRYDRDDFVEWTNNNYKNKYETNSQFIKIPQSLSKKYKYATQTYSFLGIIYDVKSYYRDIVDTITQTPTSYDCDSIMHYNGFFKAKVKCGKYSAGNIINNNTISQKDFDTVNFLYK
jgi:predicted Zn-dependent protease